MGMKVQCKSYFPAFYPMWDLNESADSSWSGYYEDKTFGGYLYNGFALRLVHGYSEFDKDMLKRTMLEHEAIFRKQVYELHRLYRIQKELMDEFEKKGLYRYSVLVDTSQSNSFSSQIASECTQRIWQMPHLPVVTTSYTMAPIASTDDMRLPLNFLKESCVQSIRFPNENGAPLKDSAVQGSKLNRFHGRTFDLHLPADVYIDSEDRDKMEKQNGYESSFRSAVPINKIYGTDCENDVKITLGTGECPSLQEDGWKPDSHKQNGLQAHSLAKLNEPIEEICHELVEGSTSNHCLGPRTNREENQGNHWPTRSNTSFLGLQRTHLTDRHSDEGSRSNFHYSVKEQVRKEWPFYYNKAGESRSSVSFLSSGLHNEKLSMSSEPIQLTPTKSHEILLSDKTDTCLRQKPTLGIEIIERSPLLASSDNSEPATPETPRSFSFDPNSDRTPTASPLVSALAKPVNRVSHTSNAAKVLPCFNGSATVDVESKYSTIVQHSIDACDKWQHNGSLRPHLRLGSEASSFQNGDHHHPQLDSSFSIFGKSNLNSEDLKGLHCTDVNLNQAVLNGIGDGLTTQQDTKFSAFERKCCILSGGISPLTRKLACNESVDLSKYVSQVELGFDPGLEWKQGEEKGLSVYRLGFPSTSLVESRMWRTEPYDSFNGKKIRGFPVLDKIQMNPIWSPLHQEQSVTDDTMGRENDGLGYIRLSPDMKAPSFGKQNPVGCSIRTNSTRFSNHINLNSMSMDDLNSTEMSPEGEVEVPSRLSALSFDAKVGLEIYLEAPIASPPENSCQEESMHSQETKWSTLVREAAENIVLMSSDKCGRFDVLTSLPLSPDPCDTLKWFTEIILRGGIVGSESSDDGLDLFELMTLNLEITKSDEFCCRPWEPDDYVEEERGTASLLLTRPRRSQARRRQQRDFQKDILPGLASLSRHEVSEDLQTIGALMRASGLSWRTGLTRRNAGRTGLHSQARERRRRRLSTLDATVTETQVNTRLTKPTNTELEVEGRAVIGWGRTTRRGRRPRCPRMVSVGDNHSHWM